MVCDQFEDIERINADDFHIYLSVSGVLFSTFLCLIIRF